MEGEPPPLRSDHADLGRAAYLSARLQSNFRWRRLHEPLRDCHAGRFGGARESRVGPDLDGAYHPHISGLCMAQSSAGKPMGTYTVDPCHAPAHGGTYVSADSGRPRQGDSGAGEVDVEYTKFMESITCAGSSFRGATEGGEPGMTPHTENSGTLSRVWGRVWGS